MPRTATLSVPLAAEEVLKAVSAHAVGLLHSNKEQQASLYKLGEAHRLWGARSQGVTTRGGGKRPLVRDATEEQRDE